MLFPSPTSFAIGLFCTSLLADIFRPANIASITLLAEKEKRTKAIGVNRLAINLGFSIGPAFGGLVAYSVGYQLLFFIDATSCVIAALLLLYFFREHISNEGKREELKEGKKKPSMKLVLEDTWFLYFLFLMFFLAIIFMQLFNSLPVYYKNELKDTSSVLKEFNLAPIELHPKAGLALINGTQFILAHAVKVVDKMYKSLSHADLIGSLMIEGLMGSQTPFYKELHQTRPFKGNIHVAARMRTFLKDSEIGKSHTNCGKVQDPYSLRCIPQVHGSSRNAWLHLKEVVETEMNSVTDNPVIISEDLIISGGSFHGQPLAMPLDYACLAAAELGSISDRRTYLSLEGNYKGTPRLLLKDTGLNSGFMILQYTTAALVSENKGLCFPASADSIPTSLGQEDHVSMGSISGRKAIRVLNNLEKILAIELLCAAQAFDFRKPLTSSKILDKVHKNIRLTIEHATEDRIFSKDIEKAIAILKSDKLLEITSENNNSFSEFDAEFETY